MQKQTENKDETNTKSKKEQFFEDTKEFAINMGKIGILFFVVKGFKELVDLIAGDVKKTDTNTKTK